MQQPSYDNVSGVPVDLVMSMQKQGLDTNQIVQSLQQQGYDMHNIYDAINQASIKSGVDNVSPESFQQGSYPQEDNPVDEQQFGPSSQSSGGMYQMPPVGSDPYAGIAPQAAAPIGMPPQGSPMQGFGGGHANLGRMEEVAEAIIDEKWKDLAKTVEKIAEWKERADQKIAAIQQQMDDIKGNFDTLHKSVLGKIGEYDNNITNLGVEIKAMEKVFKEVLPTLTDNVNELSEITKKMKD